MIARFLKMFQRALAVLSFACLLGWSLPAAALPQIQHWFTANGARVYFVEAKELPIVDLRVLFDAGSARDGDLPGLALLTNGLLAEGAAGLSADSIVESFADRGAEFSNASLRDMAWVDLRSLSDSKLLYPALELVASVLSAPDFSKQAFQRERNRMLAGLTHEKQSPASLGSKAFYRNLYGSHPYAIPSNGTEDSVNTLAIAHLREFHRRYYVAKNATVAIVGALDRAEAERVAEIVAGRLPPGEAAPALAEPAPLSQGQRLRIRHPSTQTHILLGQVGLSRTDPDYFPLYVGNHILGGSVQLSRLMDEVREQRGLAYSVNSAFLPMHVPGPFIVSLQTRNDQAEESLRVVQKVLREFIENGPTENELEAAKQNLTGGFPLGLDSNKEILSYLGMIGFYGLPLDYLATLTAKMNSVTREQVQNAFRRRLAPDKMLLITVGE